jgi:hypothetical protein
MIGDRIPGSGTSAIPIYRCETCRDAGTVFKRKCVRLDNGPDLYDDWVDCPDCDGRSRLAGEIDEPETKP